VGEADLNFKTNAGAAPMPGAGRIAKNLQGSPKRQGLTLARGGGLVS